MDPMKQLVSIFVFLYAGGVMGQQTTFNFRKLTLEHGLHDGIIRAIGQDRYGYVWICSVGALNRFDGKNVTRFTNIPGDTSSAYGSQPRSIYTDSAGRLWVGFETGLAEFDFRKESFLRYTSVKDNFISRITGIGNHMLLLSTRSGLVSFNTRDGSAFNYGHSKDPRHAALFENAVNDVFVKENKLYIATYRGLVVMDWTTQEARAVDIPETGNSSIVAVAVDADNAVWMATHEQIKLIKLQAGYRNPVVYDRFFKPDAAKYLENVMDILVDDRNRIWIATAVDGLMQYQPSKGIFVKHLHNPDLPSSPSSDSYRCIFQDDKGLIWLGGDFDGVNFFDPGSLLFSTLFPFKNHLNERGRGVGRGFAEDRNGVVWMGTHDGVSRFDPRSGQYTFWRNAVNKKPVLYDNVVRTMHCDNDGNIWIGTASGVNRYNAETLQMEFISPELLPDAFYNSITQDREGNIWFCNNSKASLHWYVPAENKFHSLYEHPQLKKFAGVTTTSYVMEDSKNRLWISYTKKGVLMLDKKTGKVTHYIAGDSPDEGLIGNQIIDIKEDLDGKIWVSSLNGATRIDVEEHRFLSFSAKNGLPGNWVSPIAVDQKNRVWMGVNGGLTMVHADRNGLTRFSLGDGLPSLGFPEHAGIQANNGDIVMPTYLGYLRFKPEDYMEGGAPVRFYLDSYSVFNDSFRVGPGAENETFLNLGSQQNSFTFNLVAVNYLNPSETWFAYKLDGFDNDWHYSKDPKAVYTNVPGGKYKFLYKAQAHNTRWDDVVAGSVPVTLNTIYYKSVWFWAMVLALICGGLYSLYRYRTFQAGQLFQLKSQAQMLEKEKAMVMYESLKQQLNPHFLFNSLTSLSGLIETDKQEAGEFLGRMSDIYRYILKNSSEETVGLREEVRFVQQYIDLLQTRFKRGLKVDIRLPDELMHYKIVPVTLQNLIENAVKHNIIDEATPLTIDIYSEEGYLVVQNNLQRKNVVETSNKRGLAQFVKLYGYLSTWPVLIEETATQFIVKTPLV